jgi:hypothetical protein
MSDVHNGGAGSATGVGLEYFATLATEDIVPELEGRINRYYRFIRESGLLTRWNRGLRLLGGLDGNGRGRNSAALTYGGNQGEHTELRINMLRAFLRSMHTYVVGSRPAMHPRAIAVDAQTTNRTALAFSLMDFELGKGNVESLASEAAWYCMPQGDSWLDVRWGKEPALPYMMDEETTYSDGSLRVYLRRADDIVRDPDAPSIEALQWIIVRSRVPRWDLVGKYPEHKDAILNANLREDWKTMDNVTVSNRRDYSSERDFVTIFEFFHIPCALLPEGRYCKYVGGEIIEDGVNIYGELPTMPMAPSPEPNTPFGYGESWDLLALQEAYDAVATQMITTQENFGLRNIFVQLNSGLTHAMIGGGLRLMQGTSQPVPIDLEGGAVEGAIAAMGFLKESLQAMTGLNDAALGDASKSQSGAALAMLHSLTVQFHSNQQRAYSQLLERTMYAVLKRYRKFCTEERMVQIVGKNKAPSARNFTGKDLQGIVGIDVEIANPVMRTTAGRVETMDKLLTNGMIKTQEQYMEGIATGRLDPIQQYALSQRMLLEMENEQLLNGQYPPVLATDDHRFHIQEHTVLVNDPLTRQDPGIADATLAHIQSHIMALNSTNPTLMWALGLEPPPAPQVDPMTGIPNLQLSSDPATSGGTPPSAPQLPPGAGPAAPPAPPSGPVGGGVQPGTPGVPEMPEVPTTPPPMA